jgi:hypothetical protein
MEVVERFEVYDSDSRFVLDGITCGVVTCSGFEVKG